MSADVRVTIVILYPLQAVCSVLSRGDQLGMCTLLTTHVMWAAVIEWFVYMCPMAVVCCSSKHSGGKLVPPP